MLVEILDLQCYKGIAIENVFLEWTTPSPMMTASGVSFTNIQAPRSHQKILREKKKNDGGGQPAALNPNRASYPGPPASSMTSSTMSSSSTSSSGERLNGTDGT